MSEVHKQLSAFRRFPYAMGVIMLAGLAYCVLAFGITFLGDDWRYLYELSSAARLLQFVTDPFVTSFAWRPLTDLVWVIDYSVWGSWAPGYHLTNLLIFFATTYLLFAIINQIATKRIAVYAAMLFFIMPTHWENIIWLAGRTDTLAILFALASILLFIFYRQHKSWWLIALSLLAFALSLLAKESAVLTPAGILLVDILFLGQKKEKGNQQNVSTMLKRAAKQYWSYIAFGFLVLGLLFARSLIIGDVIAKDSSFINSIALLPTFETIRLVISLSTLQLNFSILNDVSEWFRSLWGGAHNWIVFAYLGIILLLQIRSWKQRQFWRLILLGVAVMVLYIAPVHFLLENITTELKHIRFFYAYSIGDAIFLGALLGYETVRQEGAKYLVRIGLFAITAFFIFGSVINFIPWKNASDQSHVVINQLGVQYPNLVVAQEPQTVYVISTPGEMQGAYMFHDYLSLHQAMAMNYGNPNLEVFAVGAHAFEPAPFCGDSERTVTVLKWHKKKYTDEQYLADQWGEDPGDTARSFTGYNEIMKSGWFVQDAEIISDEGRLRLTNLGETPRLYYNLPDGSFARDWRNAVISMQDENGDPVERSAFIWRPAKAESFSQFSRIELPEDTDAQLRLCAYPNWIIGGKLNAIAFQFPSHYGHDIIINTISFTR
ncbi:MAG: hypothetical protein ABIG66_01255 [Candidatus Kerfeldbacteria bacterium]